MQEVSILDCGHTPSLHSDISTGYGQDSKGLKYCYEDCAIQAIEQMREDGRTTLYVTQESGTYFVSNWPGSLKLRCFYGKTAKHAGGFGAQRTDVWFTFDGSVWHGVNRGDSQLVSCRRTKKTEKTEPIENLIAGLRKIAEDRTTDQTA